MSELENEIVQDESLPTEGENTVNDEDQKPIFNKIQVRDVVSREKQKAYERGKREMMEQMQNAGTQEQPAAQPQVPQQQQAPQQSQNMGGMTQMSEDQIRKMIQETTPQVMQEHIQQNAINSLNESFIQKMTAAEAEFPGLEERLNQLDWKHLQPIVHLANETGQMAGAVMDELTKNPMKMGNMIALSHTQPRVAAKAMYDLANSIMQNKAAQAKEVAINDPLNPIQPSNVGSDSGSTPSIRDFKNRYKG